MNWTMRVVGVAPPGLDYPRGVEFWVASDYGSVDVVARLAPNATPEAARKEFQAFLAHDPDELRVHRREHARRAGPHARRDDRRATRAPRCSRSRPRSRSSSSSRARTSATCCCCARRAACARWRFVARSARRRLISCVSCSPRASLLAVAGGALGVVLARVLLDALIRLAPSGLPRTDLISLAGTPLVDRARWSPA